MEEIINGIRMWDMLDIILLIMGLIPGIISQMGTAYRIFSKKVYMGKTIWGLNTFPVFSVILWAAMIFFFNFILRKQSEAYAEQLNIVFLGFFILLLFNTYHDFQKKAILSGGIVMPNKGAWFWDEIASYSIHKKNRLLLFPWLKSTHKLEFILNNHKSFFTGEKTKISFSVKDKDLENILELLSNKLFMEQHSSDSTELK